MIGAVPAQLPVAAVSVFPSLVSPLVVGGEVFTGAPAVIVAVWALFAALLAAAFSAVTVTRSVSPISAVITRYVEAVAPKIFLHFSGVQASHW